jgi:glutathione S-transferase
MSELIILGAPISNFLRSVRMLAEEKGVDYTLQPERPHSDAIKAIHPFGKVPAMRHGDTLICESSAIARYIDGAFDGPKFFPEDAAGNANVEEWVSLHGSIFDQTMVRQYVLAYVFAGEDGVDRERVNAALGPMEKQLSFIDGQVSSGFVAQGRLTYADMALHPTLYYMTKYPESAEMVKGLKNLSAYIESIAARGSAKNTMPPDPTQKK